MSKLARSRRRRAPKVEEQVEQLELESERCEARGDLEGALACARRTVQLLPNEARLWCNLGIAAQRTGRIEEAVESFGRAAARLQVIRRALLPDDAPLVSVVGWGLMGHDTEVARHLLSLAVRLDRKSPVARFHWGLWLSRAGRHDEAARELRAAIRLDPEEPEPRMALAELFLDMDELDQAAVELEKVVERWPDHPEARHNLAITHLDAGRAERAAELFEGLLRERADDLFVRALLAVACARLGRTEDAREHRDRVRELVEKLTGLVGEVDELLASAPRAVGRLKN